MNIVSTQFTLDKNSFEIYISGCKHQCSQKCHNKELWDFNIGTKYDEKYLTSITKKILKFNNIIDKITIFGGEPLDQNIPELNKLLTDLKIFNKEIWLFTSYELNNVPYDILHLCDYIKTGCFVESIQCEKLDYGYILSSSNQKINKILKD